MVKIKNFNDFRINEFYEMHDLDDVFVNALKLGKLEEVYNKIMKVRKLETLKNYNIKYMDYVIRYYEGIYGTDEEVLSNIKEEAELISDEYIPINIYNRH